MSLGFSILGEAESETSKFLTFLSLKAMDTSLAHGQSCSALLHQAWWNSITNYIQFTPREIRGATTCSTSASTVQIWIIISQFSCTRGTEDKDEERWNSVWGFEGEESPEKVLNFPLAAEPSRLGLRAKGDFHVSCLCYIWIWLMQFILLFSQNGCSHVETNSSPNTAIFLSLSWCLIERLFYSRPLSSANKPREK